MPLSVFADWLLPVTAQSDEFDNNIPWRFAEQLLPAYVFSKIRIALLNAFTAEHKARAVAMGEATKNARELLEGLILLRNKIRQSNITREIIEVISSAEALKG